MTVRLALAAALLLTLSACAAGPHTIERAAAAGCQPSSIVETTTDSSHRVEIEC